MIAWCRVYKKKFECWNQQINKIEPTETDGDPAIKDRNSAIFSMEEDALEDSAMHEANILQENKIEKNNIIEVGIQWINKNNVSY